MTSLAILADDDTKWHPRQFFREQWVCTVDFQFPTVKLKPLGDDMDALLSHSNLFALITAAHLMTQTTKRDLQQRYAWKWKLTRMLYERKYQRTDTESLSIY